MNNFSTPMPGLPSRPVSTSRTGQQLLITAPLDAVPLVRAITEHAYRAGASLVTTIYADDQTTLARYQHAPDDAFDVAPAWLFNGMAEAFRGGAARLAIAGENPALLAGQDPQKLSRANKARSQGLPAGTGTDHRLCHQLVRHRSGNAGLGEVGVSGS